MNNLTLPTGRNRYPQNQSTTTTTTATTATATATPPPTDLLDRVTAKIVVLLKKPRVAYTGGMLVAGGTTSRVPHLTAIGLGVVAASGIANSLHSDHVSVQIARTVGYALLGYVVQKIVETAIDAIVLS